MSDDLLQGLPPFVLPQIPDVAAIPPEERLPAADGIYATSVLSPTRILATFYWARYRFYGKPLVLCEYDVRPLTAQSWLEAAATLNRLCTDRRSRFPVPLGHFVESDTIALQVRERSGVEATPIPPWITDPKNWQAMCQSAAMILEAGEVGYTKVASDQMENRPFLNEATILAGPRETSAIANNLQSANTATIAAFIYGLILGLDENAARDPKPKPPRAARR